MNDLSNNASINILLYRLIHLNDSDATEQLDVSNIKLYKSNLIQFLKMNNFENDLLEYQHKLFNAAKELESYTIRDVDFNNWETLKITLTKPLFPTITISLKNEKDLYTSFSFQNHYEIEINDKAFIKMKEDSVISRSHDELLITRMVKSENDLVNYKPLYKLVKNLILNNEKIELPDINILNNIHLFHHFKKEIHTSDYRKNQLLIDLFETSEFESLFVDKPISDGYLIKNMQNLSDMLKLSYDIDMNIPEDLIKKISIKNKQKI